MARRDAAQAGTEPGSAWELEAVVRRCGELEREVARLRESRQILMSLLAREMRLRQAHMARLEALSRRLRRRTRPGEATVRPAEP